MKNRFLLFLYFASPSLALAQGIVNYKNRPTGAVSTPQIQSVDSTKATYLSTPPTAANPAGVATLLNPIVTVASQAALRALTSVSPEQTYVVSSGPYMGSYRYVAGSTAPDDGVRVVVTTTDGHRLARQLVSDGTALIYQPCNCADDVPGFTAMMTQAAASGLHEIQMAPGTFKIATALAMLPNIKWYGSRGLPGKFGFGNATHTLSITYGAGGQNAITFAPGNTIEGFTVIYPNQVKTSATPIAYGYTFASQATSSSCDNVRIARIMLTNSYKGISMDWGGQWMLEDIYGQPMHTGIYVERQFDKAHIKNVHFWEFWANEGEAAHTFVLNNAVGFRLGKCDDLFIESVIGWKQQSVFFFNNYGHGTFWGKIVGVTADKCMKPMLIHDVNKLQVDGYDAVGYTRAESPSGVEIQSGGAIGSVQLTNVSTSNIAQGVVVRATAGVVSVASLNAIRDGVNYTAQYDVVNESTATVNLDRNTYKSSGIVNLPMTQVGAVGADVTPSGFATPHTWGAGAASATAITNGSRLDLTGAVDGALLKNFPGDFDEGLYYLDFDVKITSVGGIGPVQFYLRLTNTGATNDIVFPARPNETHIYATQHVRIPVFIRPYAYNSFQWVYGGSTASAAYAEITNLKVYEAAETSQTLLEAVHASQPNSGGYKIIPSEWRRSRLNATMTGISTTATPVVQTRILEANTQYDLEGRFHVQSTSTSGSPQFTVTLPAGSRLELIGQFASVPLSIEDVDYTTNTTTPVADRTYLIYFRASVTIGSSPGTAVFTVRRGGSAGTVKVFTPSELRYRKTR